MFYRLFLLISFFISCVFAQDKHEVKYLCEIVPDSIVTELLESATGVISVAIWDNYEYSKGSSFGFHESYPRFEYSFVSPIVENIKKVFLDSLKMDLDHRSGSSFCLTAYNDDLFIVKKLQVFSSRWYRINRYQWGELSSYTSTDNRWNNSPWRIVEYKALSDSTYHSYAKYFEGDSTWVNEYDSKGIFKIEKFKN